MGTTIKLYGAIAGGTENAIAQIDCPMPGHIIGVDWSIAGTLGADANAYLQLSFRSSGSFATNDDRGIVSEARLQYELVTSGAAAIMINKYVSLPDMPVMGGERLYLHAVSTASFVGTCTCIVHFDFDLDKVSVRRR